CPAYSGGRRRHCRRHRESRRGRIVRAPSAPSTASAGRPPSHSAHAPERQDAPPVSVDLHRLDAAIASAADEVGRLPEPEGFWRFDLEADVSIPAEYILMMHYTDEIEEPLQSLLAVYLREKQGAHGGWGLFPGSDFDLSCSVKAYYALKLAGADPDEPQMVRARDAILAHGGAARANTFTRITLALFQQIPCRGVPFLPVAIVLLPPWFPFNVSRVPYRPRPSMVPLSILCSLKARARNPRLVHIRELFVTPPEEERDYFSVRSPLNRVFTVLDALGRASEPRVPRATRR